MLDWTLYVKRWKGRFGVFGEEEVLNRRPNVTITICHMGSLHGGAGLFSLGEFVEVFERQIGLVAVTQGAGQVERILIAALLGD